MPLHLTCHSTYSLQEGLAAPAEPIQAAAGHGMSVLGLADHNLLTGSVEFIMAYREAGIHPILDPESDFEDSFLQLLAKSFEGWSNPDRLSSAPALESAFSI